MIAPNLPALYQAALRALAAAHSVDEAKDIRDKAVAAATYAAQARDRRLIEYATEIRLRAEIRCGELLAKMKAEGERDAGRGGDRRSRFHAETVKRLKNLGVNKVQSHRWQQLAALPKAEREARIEAAKRRAAVEITSPRRKSTEQDAITRCVAAVRAAVARAMKVAAPERLLAAVDAEIKALAAARGHDFGAASASQLEHQAEYIAQLERTVRQQELTIAGLWREQERAHEEIAATGGASGE
jgi:hypothetical protein